jgi:hypothetical protein
MGDVEATKTWRAIEEWDVSAVTSMKHLFNVDSVGKGVSKWAGADLRKWDTKNVNNMWGMFEGASMFNGDVSSFDVSKSDKVTAMFNKCHSFNGQLGKWDVSKASRECDATYT